MSTALLPSTVMLALVGDDVIFVRLPILASDNPHVSLCCILGRLVSFLGWNLSEAMNMGEEGHVQGREKNCCPASDSSVLQEIPSLAWSCLAQGDRKPAFPASYSHPVARGKAGTLTQCPEVEFQKSKLLAHPAPHHSPSPLSLVQGNMVGHHSESWV